MYCVKERDWTHLILSLIVRKHMAFCQSDFFSWLAHTHTHTRTENSIDKMVAYIHEPAVHLHNRWQQAAAGDATWRTLPFILVPAACLLNWFSGTGCFLGGKFHTHAHMHTYTHTHTTGTETATLTQLYRNMGKRQTMAGNLVIARHLYCMQMCERRRKGGASVEMADVYAIRIRNAPLPCLIKATACIFIFTPEPEPEPVSVPLSLSE